jgi:hypothetical protein
MTSLKPKIKEWLGEAKYSKVNLIFLWWFPTIK